MNLTQIFEDFDRKYQGSYVQVKLSNDRPHELFLLRRLHYGTGKFPQLELNSDKLGNILLNYNTKARVMFKVPSATYIQAGDEALFFARRPERQWKRGINASNCVLINPMSLFTADVRFMTNHVNYANIRSVFNPTFTDLTTAIGLLMHKDYHSVALSRNLAIVKNKDKITLFYRLAPIGTVNPISGAIHAPGFEKELSHVGLI